MSRYIFSTSEGFFVAEENFAGRLTKLVPQPPVSVMSLNIFKRLGEQKYLLGSFNGMLALKFIPAVFFEYIAGPFYILYVPLSDLCLIMVLVSGFFLWWNVHRRRA